MKYKLLINNPSNIPKVYISSITEDEFKEIREFIKLYISSAKEDRAVINDEFYSRYKINVLDIIAHGSPSKSVKPIVEKYIPHIVIRWENNEPITAWRCAQNGGELKDQINNPSTAGLIIHEDALSAWNCIINLLGRPSYVIIYKQ